MLKLIIYLYLQRYQLLLQVFRMKCSDNNYYSYFFSSGSAIYGLDFVTSSSKFSLSPNDRRHCIAITILDDNINEKNETFGIHAGNDTVFVTILDNDCKVSSGNM